MEDKPIIVTGSQRSGTRSLSILIPSKNEPYLKQTLEDIIKHSETSPQILVGLDGWQPDFEMSEVTFIHRDNIGQRAITNELFRYSNGDYVMKTDAHCSFGQGFDRKMLEEIDDKTILTPQMGVLDPINWAINGRKLTTNYVFDKNFVMQYGEPAEETMCLQGSCWMISRENYWYWNVCDETLGSWGGQGVELGIAAWLNGGRCKSTKSTFYGHVFRHSDKDFPYDRGDDPGRFATEELKRRYQDDPEVLELVRKYNYPCDWKFAWHY